MANSGVIPFGQAPWEQGQNVQSASASSGVIPFGQAPWEQKRAPTQTGPGIAQTALEHFANGATLGYLPQLQAVTEPLAFKIGNWLTGENVQPDSYINARDENIQRLADEARANPKTAIGSELAGAGADALVMPGPEAESITGGILKGAGIGASYGALSNPGDQQGVINPVQLDSRLVNAGRGALVGGIAGGVSQGVAKGINKLANAPESLSKAANAQAVKASGAMLKDFRALNGNNRLQALGQFALDNGLVQGGDTVADVAKKASALQQDAGSRLDALYSQAQKAVPNVTASEKITPIQADNFGEAISKAEKIAPDATSVKWDDNANSYVAKTPIGLNLARDKSYIIFQIQKNLGDAVDGENAVSQVSNYLDQLKTKYGDTTLDPKTANNIETEISKKIRWAADPRNAQPATQDAFRVLRTILSNKVDNQVAFLGKASGDEDVASRLAQANKDYGFSKQIAQMAKDKINRTLTNNHFSLTDRIAGGSGAVAGGLAGSLMGNDWRSDAEGALVGGVSAAVLNHFGGEYGNAMLANALDRGATVANAGPAQIASLTNRIINPGTANFLTGTAARYGTNGEDLPSTSQSSLPIRAPYTAPIQEPTNVVPQTQPMVQPQPKRSPASPQPMPNQQMPIPTKGPQKWASDGFQNLLQNASPDGQRALQSLAPQILNDPKSRKLLILASSAKSSKQIQNIMSQIQARFGGQR